MQHFENIKAQIKLIALEQGFQQISVADTDTSKFFERFANWVAQGLNGDMGYLANNQSLRQNPDELHPGTCRVISLRYNYLPKHARFSQILRNPGKANISRYALGRDYHKLMRKKLKHIAVEIAQMCENFDYRVFVDSAPVLETEFANKSGLGWKGKHSLIINEEAGSWFFLGEIFINLPLPIDQPVENSCGSCTSCIKLCPTDAIVAPYKVDARRCISYLTIENKSSIPVEFRKKIGNRIYGCDDCQLACPWNRYASLSEDNDFSPRHNLDYSDLFELFQWTESDFKNNLEGSPIRRIGYQNWLRNLAVGLGNGPPSNQIIEGLESKKSVADPMVIEHIDWAINQLKSNQTEFFVSRKTLKLVHSIDKMLPRDA